MLRQSRVLDAHGCEECVACEKDCARHLLTLCSPSMTVTHIDAFIGTPDMHTVSLVMKF